MKSDNNAIIVCLLLSVVIFAIDLSIPLGVAGGVPYIAVVLVSLWSEKKRLTIMAAVVGSILTLLGYFYSPSGGEMWKVLSNRALALFAIWTTAALSLQRRKIIVEREQALRDRELALENQKILRGLIPICASCKKIRDDEGYWNEVADYISEHSEAEFTHGICAECVNKLYPGISKGKDQDNEKT